MKGWKSVRHRRRKAANTMLLVAVALLLSACEPPGAPPSLGAAEGTSRPAGGSATALSDAEFEALEPDAQYRLVNKLLGTLYKGVPVADFYALDTGRALRARLDGAPTLASIRTALATDLPPEERARLDREIVGDEDALDEAGQPSPLEPLWRLDDARPKQMPLARMIHYPVSRDAYVQWMAWHLANTILFSPAEEIDSADITDVQNLFRRLAISIDEGLGIREMIATHQRTVENWRRFRSPEDNTREMMEIYLGIFDNDAEVPLASQACQDLYLTDEREGYKLARTDFPNIETVTVLDRPVLDCNDFYDVVAAHPLVIPRVTGVLVDYFHAGLPTPDRLALTEAIAASNPATFEDLFTAILFSKRYLLDTERVRSFEESYLSMAARLAHEPHPDLLRGMTRGRGRLARTDMGEMGWPSMSLKLGRVADIPTDSLSVANHHKALRETLMLDAERWRRPLGLRRPEAPEPAPPEPPAADASARDVAAHEKAVERYAQDVAALDPDARREHEAALAAYEQESALSVAIEDLNIGEVLDYLFLAAVHRRPNGTEREQLTALFLQLGHLDESLGNAFARPDRLDDIGTLTLDYLSRLPETYYLPRVDTNAP